MPQVPFASVPDHARLWVFAADRALTPQEQQILVREVETGLAAWQAHGSPVTWGHTLMHDQFLMVGIDETHTELSGCSIDSATRRMKDLEKQLGISLLDNARVFYRDSNGIRTVDRPGFRGLAQSGAVSSATVVFNNIIPTVAELRRGEWEVPAARSWHAKAFPLSA